MAGLLDIFEGMDKKTQLGLLMAGAQMMQTQRGDSPFAAIGNGLLGFANGMLGKENQDKEDARQSRLDDVDMQLKQAQAQHYLNGGDGKSISLHGSNMGFVYPDPKTGKLVIGQTEDGKTPLPTSADIDLAYRMSQSKVAPNPIEIKGEDGAPIKTTVGNAFGGVPSKTTDLSKLPQKVLQDGQYHDLADYIGAAQQFVPNIMQVESGGNPKAESRVGAKGLMQIMDKTGATPGMNVIPLQNKSNAENVRFGTDYFAALLKENNGDVARALSAYNQGQGNLNQKGIANPDYVNDVFNAKPSQQVIDLSNPITKPAVAGMQIAAKNGVSPIEAINKGLAIAEQSVNDLKQVQGAAQSMYKGQSTEKKLALETEAKRQQAEQEAAIKLKNAAPLASAEKTGAIQGENTANAQAALPSNINDAEVALKDIQELLDHPGLNRGTGLNAAFFDKVPGTDAYDFKVKHAKVIGDTGKQAVNILRGLGAMAIPELNMAQSSVSSIGDRSQSTEQFKKGLIDLKNVFTKQIELAKNKANGGNSIQQPMTFKQPTISNW